jgi:penicillin-binding protein 1A
MKAAHQGVPTAALPSGTWRSAAPLPEPAQVADSVLGIFGAGPAAAPQHPHPAPPPAAPTSGGRPTVHGLESLLPPADIPAPGAKRADHKPPQTTPVGDNRNFLEKLFSGG